MRMARVFALVVVALAAARCSCSGGGAAEGAPCADAQQCSGDLVCNPADERCAVLECEADDDCGRGALCQQARCVDNVVGGPCDDDGDCPAAETCRSDGACGAPGAAGSSCGSAQDCLAGLVCPSSTCADDAPCSVHADCGAAGYCAGGVCEPAADETPCESDEGCRAEARCLGVVCIDDDCPGDAYAAEPVPANVLITIDRSGSMRDDIGNDGRKWDVARAAVYQLLADQNASIRFGLNLYPGYDQACDEGEDCGTGAINVDVADDTAGAIGDFLQDAQTCSFGTPTAENLALVTDYQGLKDPARDNYVLLITDGQSTCDDPVPLVEELAAALRPVKTFVVGFGSGVDPGELADMAEAGGTARAGDPVYYQADDAASLQLALDEIAGSVLSCEYQIPNQPDDADGLKVFMNGARVPRDTTGATGWDYTPSTGRLSFGGNACVALKSGVVTDLTIVYGCPEGAGAPDAGPAVGYDAGPVNAVDAGPGACTDRCAGQCGDEGCALPPGGGIGQCQPCANDSVCCPGSICITSTGQCLSLDG